MYWSWHGGVGVIQYVRHVLRRGTLAQVAAATGLAGEPFWVTDEKNVRVADGAGNFYPLRALSGNGTLTAGTTTVVADSRVTASSKIMVQATSAAFAALQTYVSAKGAGSFTLTTLAAAGGESFDYVIVN